MKSRYALGARESHRTCRERHIFEGEKDGACSRLDMPQQEQQQPQRIGQVFRVADEAD